jgi:hypothetical protein
MKQKSNKLLIFEFLKFLKLNKFSENKKNVYFF